MGQERTLSIPHRGTRNNPFTLREDDGSDSDPGFQITKEVICVGNVQGEGYSRADALARHDQSDLPNTSNTNISPRRARRTKGDGRPFQKRPTDPSQDEAILGPASFANTVPQPSLVTPNELKKISAEMKGKSQKAHAIIVKTKDASLKASTSSNVSLQGVDSEMIDAQLSPLDYNAISALWDKYCKKMQVDHARFARIKLKQAKYQQKKADVAANIRYKQFHEETEATRSAPEWWKTPLNANPAEGLSGSVNITIQNLRPGATKISIKEQLQTFCADAADVPQSAAYFDIQKSQLAPSDKNLVGWPNIVEVIGEPIFRASLHRQLNFRVDGRDNEIECIQMGIQYQPYEKLFLEELGLSEAMMLHFVIDDWFDDELLGKDNFLWRQLSDHGHKKKLWEYAVARLTKMRKQVGKSPLLADAKIRTRKAAGLENDPDSRKTFEFLALVFEAICSHKSSLGEFSIWYMLVASPSLDIRNILAGDDKPKLKYSAATHFDLACRTCSVFGCTRHGLASEWDHKRIDSDDEEDEDDDESEEEQMTKSKGKASKRRKPEEPKFKLKPITEHFTAIYREQKGQRLVRAPTGERENDPEFDEPELYHDPNTWRPPKVYDDRGLEQDRPKNLLFFPCDHKGDCVIGVCRCAKAIIEQDEDHGVCEKSCGCPRSCPLRFKGCTCAAKGRPCSIESRCACVAAMRECDPDLCHACGVYDTLDPESRDKPKGFFKESCQNCDIQRGISKRTLLGHSSRHGTGLFAAEVIQKGEYVDEYVGEKVSWNESERRGRHDKLSGVSYLFDTGVDQTIDSMRLGNKTRFINHEKESLINLEQRKRFINGEYRLAFFAKKKIIAGQELFFNYGSSFWPDGSPESESQEVVVPVKTNKTKGKRKAKKGVTKNLAERSQAQMEKMKATLFVGQDEVHVEPHLEMREVTDSDEDFDDVEGTSDDDILTVVSSIY